MNAKNMYAAGRTRLRDAVPLEMPLCVSIEPTNLCNFKCVMCYHGNNEYAEEAKPLRNMEMEVFEKTVEDLERWKEKTGRRVKLMKLYSLGEPLLHRNIADMVRRIKEADICELLEITTNGSLLSAEIAEKLVDYGLDILRISVYAAEEERCKYITGSAAKPEEIRASVAYLRKYRDWGGQTRPQIQAKMLDTYSEENEKFLRLWEGVADVVGIDQPFQIASEQDVFERLYPGEAESAHRQAMATNLFAERRVCRYPFTHMTVRNDGRVVACCTDWLRELCIGDVTKQPLEEIWNSKELYEIRCQMLTAKGSDFQVCRNCELPYRDLPEDDLDGFPVEKLSYDGKG